MKHRLAVLFCYLLALHRELLVWVLNTQYQSIILQTVKSSVIA